MVVMKLIAAGALATSALALNACVDDGYGYGGVDVGYGAPYGYYDGYYDSGYAPSYYGWYGGYYYPGSGVYVYDHDRRPYRWNNWQRGYWHNRWNNGAAGGNGGHWNGGGRPPANWGGFHNEPNRNPGWTGGHGAPGGMHGRPHR